MTEIRHPAFSDVGPDSLTAKVNATFRSRKNESTHRSIDSKLKKFGDFCLDNQLLTLNLQTFENDLPVITCDLLCYYAVWARDNGITTYDSLKGYLSAVRGYCRDNNQPDPATDETGGPSVHYYGVIKGLKRDMVVDEQQIKRTPITKRRLDLILEAAFTEEVLSHELGLNVAAGSSLAFYLLLRLGEMCNTSGKVHKMNHAQRQDVTFYPSIDAEVITSVGFRFRVPTKMECDRKGYEMQLFPTNTEHCPVKILSQLFREQPRPAESPLFDFRSQKERANNKPVHASRAVFVRLVNMCLEEQGEQTDNTVKGHSFRQGGCSTLLAMNVAPWLVSLLGRWRSDCWKRYAFAGSETIAATMHKMAHAPTTDGINHGRYMAPRY